MHIIDLDRWTDLTGVFTICHAAPYNSQQHGFRINQCKEARRGMSSVRSTRRSCQPLERLAASVTGTSASVYMYCLHRMASACIGYGGTFGNGEYSANEYSANFSEFRRIQRTNIRRIQRYSSGYSANIGVRQPPPWRVCILSA